MIRPVTCLCLLAAFGSGLYLYSEKHRTELLDRDIGRQIRAAETARARTGLLRAEWALLNEPGRLQDMSGRYLALHPMAPTQFVQLADLANHLPAPVAAQPGGGADDDDAAAPAASEPAPAPVPAVVADAAPLPSHHPMMPPAKSDVHAGTKLLAKADARHAPRHVALADRDDMPMHDGLLARSSPLPLATPQPVGARVYSALARPSRAAEPRAAIVSAVPTYAPALTSALGGGGALPPPVPYGR